MWFYLDQDHGDMTKGFKKALDKVTLFNVTVVKDKPNALNTVKAAVDQWHISMCNRGATQNYATHQ